MVTSDNRYPGGKGLAGLTPWIVAKMRTHSFYAELFAGKAAVFRNKPPALESLLMDMDHGVIDWLQRLRVPGTIVRRGDGIRWLRENGPELSDDALIYLDPPYKLSTRVKQKVYRYEMTDDEHGQLLEAALIANCGVMISGYPSQMYDDYLAEWYRFETQAITRGGTMRTEVLWTNYDPGTVSPMLAIEYSGLGDDFRQRERVSRKINRWQSKLQALPDQERRALLLALLDAERDKKRSTIDGSGEGRPSL